MSMTITAHAPVETLVYQLSSVEWSVLDAPCFRGARAILQALARAMTVRKQSLKAETDMTAEQLARQSGYGLRWTRNALHDLEDAGVIKWQRGGIRDGKPEAGIIRIVKSVLARWIRDALPTATRRERKRRERTARRLEKLHVQNLQPRLCRSAHEAVSADLSPYRGDKARSPRSRARFTQRPEDKSMKHYSKLNTSYLPKECRHGIGKPVTCPKCRRIAIACQYAGKDTKEQQPALTAPVPAPMPMKPRTQEHREPTPFEDYMTRMYPDATPREWARLALHDQTARLLAQEQ